MARRIYTPAEANAALDVVRPIVARMREAALDVALAQPEARAFKERAESSGGVRPSTDERLAQVALARGRKRVIEAMRELDGLGIEVKDPRRGLIDFASERDGEVVELCWLDGEAAVAFWHRVGDGFAGRHAI